MDKRFPYEPVDATVALKFDDYYVWDCSVIKANGKYYMFSSRWPKELGFGANWLFNSEIVVSCSDAPEGPFKYVKTVLPRRGKQYFDGMNTHNTNIKYWNGKYYLYYMGTTYEGEPIKAGETPSPERIEDVWQNKRIGVAVSDTVDGEYVRQDKPLLETRPAPYWDNQATTNPTVAILPSGETYMIYKSRTEGIYTLQLGITKAPRPDGPFVRIKDNPLFQFDNPNMYIEDPFLWYNSKTKKFCLLSKDDVRFGDTGITGEWGAGFYTESDDCINFKEPDGSKVYSRTINWKDGHTSTQCNLERVSLLFDENGEPTHIYFASGEGKNPYAFEGLTYIVCMRLKKID